MGLTASIDDVLAASRAGVERPTPVQAAAAGAILIDTRPVADRDAEGVIPGAWIVDRNLLEWRLDPASPDRLDGVDDRLYDSLVVVVCNEGYASSLAAESLRRIGLRRATDLAGGYRAWRAAGLPVAPGPGTPATRRPPRTASASGPSAR